MSRGALTSAVAEKSVAIRNQFGSSLATGDKKGVAIEMSMTFKKDRWRLHNRPLSECDPIVLKQQKAAKDKNQCITESETMDFELAVHSLSGSTVKIFDKREVQFMFQVRAAFAQDWDLAGVRLLLDGKELHDNQKVETICHTKPLYVIFHEDYLMVVRMKGNMSHKRRLFKMHPLRQIIQEQQEVWISMGDKVDRSLSALSAREQEVRPHWMGGAFVLVTTEHAKYVKRAIAILSPIERQILFTTTSVIISPELKGDLENVVNEYIQAWRDELQGHRLKDLLKCFPRDTKIRISLPFD